jgi:hypothetical protein
MNMCIGQININNCSFIEDYMQDSTHYSKDYDKVKSFLSNEIIGGSNV